MDFTKALNRLGESAIMREDEPDDIGAAFQKFAVVTKELAHLMKNLVSSSNLGNGRYRVFLAELEFGRENGK
jgi:hypothetical protein